MDSTRTLVTVALAAAATLAIAPAAQAQRFHQFYVAGATAQVKAVEDAETPSDEPDGQNDKVHAEFTLSYAFVKPRGIFTYGTMLVPFAGPAKPARTLTGGALVKGTYTVRASGQTWIRTGYGEDTTGHYASWSCDLKPERFRRDAGFTPVAAGAGRYAVQSQVGGLFSAQPDAGLCTQSEPGAVPGGGFEISGGRKALLAMRVAHLFTGRELRAKRTTLRLSQAGPGQIDCRNGYAVACTDVISATGTLKLAKACRKPATVGGGQVTCNDALPVPR